MPDAGTLARIARRGAGADVPELSRVGVREADGADVRGRAERDTEAVVRLENAGVLYSESLGRTRLYRLNPRYPFLRELKALLSKALVFYPEEERQALLMARQRPRLAGKPI